MMSCDFLWLFLTVLWVSLWCVIVVFPGHPHLLNDFFYIYMNSRQSSYQQKQQKHQQIWPLKKNENEIFFSIHLYQNVMSSMEMNTSVQ